MEERERRVGHNQALFRQVNERLERLHKGFELLTNDVAVVCECGNLECTEQIRMDIHAYEQLRSDPTRFVVVPGHEAAGAERVVSEGERYVIVEKRRGEPSKLARETKPPPS